MKTKSPNRKAQRSRTKPPLGRGFVEFGPYRYAYSVEKEGAHYRIAFEGKNTVTAIADRDNIHQRAREVWLAFMEEAYKNVGLVEINRLAREQKEGAKS